MTANIPSLALPGSSARVPQIGFGLWKVDKARCADLVVEAARLGYRAFDSACDYGNEEEVGDGLSRVFATGLRREDVFVTSKLWNTYHRKEYVRDACLKSLRDLKLQYLDLYLIHFPTISLRYVPFDQRYPPEWIHDPDAADPKMELDHVPLQETWRCMEDLVREGLVKAIGLCNVNVQTLVDVIAYSEIQPSVVQVELHPTLTQEKLVRFVQQECGMLCTAFSPLGSGSYVELNMASAEESVLNRAEVKQIAASKSKTPAQVVLRWGVQRNTVVIPKSNQVARLEENLNIFDFELSDSEMAVLSGLNANRRLNNPGEFCQGMGCFIPIYD
ncbi:putative NAD(P)H-dependent D-xylose reductase xyl1 [Porphyridium purpureum]|uniref:Putative NAD(P)H-dependent D-xylose reductase xyl1 n=1 Tax=Porphyridium purpureum TaxID=35688 RepID=A0A5J4YU26_PORPP|nr:putative NAD(P)H-dependent D-xylose reductase xyl1 [Porphyridium purpureum]|eukprot:POR6023..scf227_4